MPPRPKKAITTSPSVTQVAEAQLFIAWIGSGWPVQAVCCHSGSPVFFDTANTSRTLPFSSDDVRKIRSPQITGDDCPMPGSVDFQTILSPDHFTGRDLSL